MADGQSRHIQIQVPSPTIIQPRGFVSFNPTQLGFSLSSAGERILLVNSNQTRVIDALDFRPQANGISCGRYPDGAPLFQELSQVTDRGANAPPLSREIVINEIMYHPISENSDDEYLELHNRGASTVDLGGWRFTEGITFRIPTNTMIAAGGYLVVAGTEPTCWRAIPISPPIPRSLSAITTAASPATANALPLHAGNRHQRRRSTERHHEYYLCRRRRTRIPRRRQLGNWSDGGGNLELIDARADNRLSPNWADSDESSKHRGPRSNTPVCSTMVVTRPTTCRDHARGRRVPGGRRRVVHKECRQSHQQLDVETGLTGWTAHGDHESSSLANVGYNSSRSLQVRASAAETLGRTKSACRSQVHWRRDKRRQSAPKSAGCAVGRKFCFACVEVTSKPPIVCCCRRTSEHRGRSTAVRSPMPARRSLSNTLARCARSEPGHRRFRRVSDIDSVFRLQQDTASTQAQT